MSISLAGESCPPRQSWSSDLGKCMECSICEKAGKSDFCQTCVSVEEQFDIPWLIIGLSAVGFVLIIVILTVTVYLRRCRRKSKFTTPIEETGAHSAEELLIH
uniref:Tumor necrosis factor receptor superfamily member 12A n=1 Tax=Leptobrachium leishanense TaxID=445787 RepID=A0A8C5QUY9_9ANUR